MKDWVTGIFLDQREVRETIRQRYEVGLLPYWTPSVIQIAFSVAATGAREVKQQAWTRCQS